MHLYDSIPDERRTRAADPLPRMHPVAEADWLVQDDRGEAIVAEKARILAREGRRALDLMPVAGEAAGALLDMVTGWLALHGGARIGPDLAILTPGRSVPLRRDAPMETLAALVPEDFCLLQKVGGEHVLQGALLAMPSGWTLAEKLGRPMSRLHRPVPPYTDEVGRRVQRMFDHVGDRILGRANCHAEPSGDLWTPLSESQPKPPKGPFWRSERQTIRALPVPGWLVFTIHVAVAPREVMDFSAGTT